MHMDSLSQIKQKADANKAARDAASAKTFNQNPNGPTRKLATDTSLGQQLGVQISESLAGRPSNKLIGARTAGNEALARKANDLRGLAGMQAANSGMIGQGAAVAAQQQTEVQNLRAMGDFQGQMGQLAVEEQAGAVNQASNYLGQVSNDWQSQEMQRQAMVGENFKSAEDDFDNLMRMIEDPKMLENGGGALDDLLTNAYGRFQSDPAKMQEFKDQLAESASSRQEIASVAGWASQASPRDLEAHYDFSDPKGIKDINTGEYVDTAMGLYLTDAHTTALAATNGPLWTKLGDPAQRQNMTESDWQAIMNDPDRVKQELNPIAITNTPRDYNVGSYVSYGDTVYRVDVFSKSKRDGKYSRNLRLVDPTNNDVKVIRIIDNKVNIGHGQYSDPNNRYTLVEG